MKIFSLKLGRLKIWWILALSTLLLAGIIVGSFLDLSISSSIASKGSVFGIIGEQFAIVPTYLIPLLAGSILFAALTKKRNKKSTKVIGWLLMAADIGVATYFGVHYATGSMGYGYNIPQLIGYLIVTPIMAGVFFLSYLLVDKNKSSSELFKIALPLLVGTIAMLLFINFVFKGLVYRPRFRALAWDNEILGTSAIGMDRYQPWWVFAFYKKPDWFVALDLPSDFIKSWPSGHSASYVMPMFLPMLLNAYGFKKPKHLDLGIFLGASAYGLAFMFSRIVIGAHFLSDVCFGGLLSIFIIMVFIQLSTRLLDKYLAKPEPNEEAGGLIQE